MPEPCIFCEIVRGTSAVSWVYQDDTGVAFMAIQPITQGHMLVVPREHAVLMTDINETAAMRTFRVARKLAAAARQTLGASGVNLLVMDGEAAYQDVPHFHGHVRERARAGSARCDRGRDPRRRHARYGVTVTVSV